MNEIKLAIAEILLETKIARHIYASHIKNYDEEGLLQQEINVLLNIIKRENESKKTLIN